jgi:uncharacterized 2Fe-2S/4Fe-4S cluster protein (DUF4445 family)
MNKMVEVQQGSSLLDAIREAGVMFRSICGGEGDCGTCRVILNKGKISNVSTKFEKWLSSEEITKGYRLACLTRVESDCEFTIPVESRVFKPKILLNMKTIIDKINPASKKYIIELPIPHSPKDGLISFREYSGKYPMICKGIYEKLFLIKNKEYGTVTMTTTNNFPEIIRLEKNDTTNSNYGLALDLGTTTVVAFLVDLINGKILKKISELNSQITFGEALVSRISYGSKPAGLKKLQESAVRSINDLIKKITSNLDLEEEEITDICVSGNTVMNYLLAGLNPSYLAYVDGNEKVSRKPIIRKTGSLRIRANPESYVYCLPNVSRFLGGDAIGDVLASGLNESEEISLLVDMGTNGEIILGNKTWFMSSSCASGPAFEGGGIRFGMRAMRGGIEHVKINPKTYKVTFTVIGDISPRGICGSGIIDLAAEMFNAGILDFTGNIMEGKTPLVRKGIDGLEFVLVKAEKTEIKRDIVLTQRDMEYLIDSKAATCGAIIVLMRKLKVNIHDIKNFYLAGAFGAYTNIENATKFGIFPEFPKAKVKPIGNGSIAGAYASLISIRKRRQAEEIAKKMFYVDLLTDPMFSEAYSESIYIPGNKMFFPTYGF